MIGTRSETNIALLAKPDPAPLITIITVVLNARDLIEPTLRSVAEQSYENIQHIIIDGGSSDGTLEVIMANEASVDLWISEHDHGVYDAMNKGIEFARGEWITFLNAGDVYTSQRMIAELAPLMVGGADILYGDHEIRFANYTLIYRARPAEELWKNMVFCHQTVFARTSLVKEFMFSTSLRISADYEMMMRAYLAGCRFVNSRMVIASVLAGGMSDSAVYSGVLERFMVLHRLSLLSFKIIAYYLFLFLHRTVRVLSLAVLPRTVVIKARKLTKGIL